MSERIAAIAKLARWLGPWTANDARPRAIRRRAITVAGRPPFDAWVYRSVENPTGAILVVPGLHYLGPADPRLDRFLAVLANAGLLVLCPFLPDLRRLQVGPSLVDDSRSALDALLAQPDCPPVKPALFSISFGNYPALHLAADRSVDIGALIMFGGYATFEEVIEFSLGRHEVPLDPLNRPVVFLVLLDAFEVPDGDRDVLRRAIVSFIRATWGKPEMRERSRRDAVATAAIATLPAAVRSLFAKATGLDDSDASAEVAAALERGRSRLAHLHLDDVARRVTCPTTIVHGRDDDVIPATAAAALARWIPHADVHLTGLYGHTGKGALDLRAVAGEARAMHAILRALVDGPRQPRGR